MNYIDYFKVAVLGSDPFDFFYANLSGYGYRLTRPKTEG
jgi:hypothetical protein